MLRVVVLANKSNSALYFFRQILAERGIDFPSKKKTGTGNTHHMNNNNHEKVSL